MYSLVVSVFVEIRDFVDFDKGRVRISKCVNRMCSYIYIYIYIYHIYIHISDIFYIYIIYMCVYVCVYACVCVFFVCVSVYNIKSYFPNNGIYIKYL